MLMLTRGEQERVFVKHKGETLEILISSINGKQVRIGFQGDKSFQIKRDDIINNEEKKEVSGNV